MKKIQLFLFALVASIMSVGCATTTDPSQGGLFSYSPKAYEQRKAERTSRLSELKQEQQEHEAQKQNLTDSVAARKAEHAALNKKIAGLNKELSSYKAANKAQQNKLSQLRSRQAALAKRAGAVESSSMSTAAKEAEAARLKRDVERLSNEFNSLSML